MTIVITMGSAFQPKRNGRRLRVVPMGEYIPGEIQSQIRAWLTMMAVFVSRFVMSMLRSLNQLGVMLRAEAPMVFTTWLVMHGSG